MSTSFASPTILRKEQLYGLTSSSRNANARTEPPVRRTSEQATSATRDWVDLIALVAILATAIVLITLGHMTAGGLMTVCGALVTLYGAWSRYRPTRGHRQLPPPDLVADKEADVDA
jgi:hypothetical protein